MQTDKTTGTDLQLQTYQTALQECMKEIGMFSKNNALIFMEPILDYQRIYLKTMKEGQEALENGTDIDQVTKILNLAARYATMRDGALRALSIEPNQILRRGQQTQEEEDLLKW